MRCSADCSMLLAGALAAAVMIPSHTHAAEALEEVFVTATLRSQQLVDVPNSVTVLDGRTLKDAGQQHFEDVLGLVPNLNWAGGTSRPRFFQIRGIGEREQYEGAPNPSVGFLIDDIDFSGLGMAATLYDVKQVEVLRGPQGTRFGANALAGLIAVRGNDPEQELHFGAEGSVAEYNTRSLGAYATAPIESLDSAWRLSLQQYRSDGFRYNSFLNRKDTDGRDELTGRFKWHWQATDTNTLDFTLLHANIDNGYDAWSIDNTRVSLSDKPGKDAQRTTGASLRWNQQLSGDLQLTAIGTYADNSTPNSYDGDWGNTQSWQDYMHNWSIQNGVPGNDWQNFVYDYTYSVERHRSTSSLDVRLASNHDPSQINWLVGVYALNLREHISETSQGNYQDPVAYAYFTSSDDFLDSHYKSTNAALYGQLDGLFTAGWSWSVGLRGEHRGIDYDDYRTEFGVFSDALAQSRNENMWGGQISTVFDLDADTRLYAAISRGYKAGGFNLGSAARIRPLFTQESVLNYELGIKGNAWDGRLYFDTSVFYEQRHNLQELTSAQLVHGDPNTFVFFTDNIDGGYNAGIESSLHVSVTRALELGGTLGLLRTHTDSYVDNDGLLVPGRDQAHAPEYTASVYGTWRHNSGLMARVDVSAKDNFYYSAAPSQQQSHAYSLTNVKLGYERATWSAYGWVRNAFNKDYTVRAFEFGNEPPDFFESLYVQHGEPRQVGVTASWKY